MSAKTPINIHAFVTPDRRDVIRSLGLGAGLFLGEALLSRALAKPVFKADPFSLGLASGSPAADGFVIWTKLAPEPLRPDGGMPRAGVQVRWDIAADEAMSKPVRSGESVAVFERGHSVHVEIGGLEPGREYFYRFEAGGVRSSVGRAKTLPVKGTEGRVRFASAGCQWYEEGFYTAWRRIAEERFDFIIHYGDYIYEYAARKPDSRRAVAAVRHMPGAPGKCLTLADFRQRYAIYKLDPDLQAAHASAPFVVSFDDHEVENNWAGYSSEYEGVTKQAFALRRAAAFQAWYEHMPLRSAQMPRGPDILAHQRMRVGNLLQIDVLDTRQHRDPQPCGDGWKSCPEAKAAHRTMLGRVQEQWLASGLRAERAQWNVLAQQVPFARLDRNPDPSITETDMDKWDGAEAARSRILALAEEARVSNLVVLSGDVHHNRALEIKRDFDDPSSRNSGVEFVATSISSAGDGADQTANAAKFRTANPHLKFYNAQRGYVGHIVDAQRWQADYQVLDKVSHQHGHMSTRARFTVEAGRPELQAV